MKEKGFTLIEILIVVIILAVLVVITVPLGMDFYRAQQIDSQSKQLLQVLRQARLKAFSGEMDSAFGVYFTDNSYTFFKGDSYVTRDKEYDKVFEVPLLLDLSGLQEVVFSKMGGVPSSTGNIVLSNKQDSQTITVNEVGRINLEL